MCCVAPAGTKDVATKLHQLESASADEVALKLRFTREALEMTDRFTRVVHLEDDMEAALQWCAAHEVDEA